MRPRFDRGTRHLGPSPIQVYRNRAGEITIILRVALTELGETDSILLKERAALAADRIRGSLACSVNRTMSRLTRRI